MKIAGGPFTLGFWSVKEGKEAAFVAEWTAFAEWTARHQGGAGTGYLLQDPERPREFISFGPWKDTDAINQWRERPEFKAFAVKARELCDEFRPRTLALVAVSDSQPSRSGSNQR